MAAQQAELQNRLVAVQMLSERREALAEQVGSLQQLSAKAQVGRAGRGRCCWLGGTGLAAWSAAADVSAHCCRPESGPRKKYRCLTGSSVKLPRAPILAVAGCRRRAAGRAAEPGAGRAGA